MLTLFGHALWWLPRWLDRLLPHVDIEGEAGPPGVSAPPGPAAGRTPARPMPGTEPWPEPFPPVHETTVPGDGQVRADHVPDE